MDPPAPHLAVVGAGPAGLAAALQAHRMGIPTLLLEKDRPGGALAAAFLVENYPGFPSPVAGKELAGRMARQASRLGVPLLRSEVERILPVPGGFLLAASEGEVLARAVIVATGSRPRRLGLPGEEELLGNLIFQRADRLLENGPARRVLVAGGGDVAFDQAAYLASRGMEVRIVHRGGDFRALPRIMATARALGVRVFPNTSILALEGRDDELVVSLSSPEGEENLRVDRMLSAVGKEPDLSLLPRESLAPGGTLPLDGRGRTGLEGLFAAGDLRRGRDRQAVVAAGDGMAAALEAARYLEEAGK